jgi:hypothetical protein
MRRSIPRSNGGKIVKKAYASPTLVKYGSAVAATLGAGGKYLEFINWRPPLPGEGG